MAIKYESNFYNPAPITLVQASEMAHSKNIFITVEELEKWALANDILYHCDITGDLYVAFAPFWKALQFKLGKHLRANASKFNTYDTLKLSYAKYKEAKNNYESATRSNRRGSGTRKPPSAEKINLERLCANWINTT